MLCKSQPPSAKGGQASHEQLPKGAVLRYTLVMKNKFSLLFLGAILFIPNAAHAQVSIDFPTCFTDSGASGIALNKKTKQCALYEVGGWGSGQTALPSNDWTSYIIDDNCSSKAPKPFFFPSDPSLANCEPAYGETNAKTCCNTIGYEYIALPYELGIAIEVRLLKNGLYVAIAINLFLALFILKTSKSVVDKKKQNREHFKIAFFLSTTITLILAQFILVMPFLKSITTLASLASLDSGYNIILPWLRMVLVFVGSLVISYLFTIKLTKVKSIPKTLLSWIISLIWIPVSLIISYILFVIGISILGL